MNRAIIIITGALLFSINSFSQTYQDNENGQYEDMLTPEYYNSSNGSAFREEVNRFVHFARQTAFQHPLEDASGQIPTYSINRGFGDGIGPGGQGSHHPAIDYYIENASTLVDLYAAHDGFVTTSKEVDRYRHYLSISTDIQDSTGTVIGKMFTLYAHIDLDLDSVANLDLDGKYVKKGDLVSNHLYSGTMGGPHLHFEIRYYRSTDSGIEDFYGGPVADKTSPSSGSWTYGFWNPNVGYGFAHPLNHLNTVNTGVYEDNFHSNIKVFPNPTKDFITIELDNPKESKLLTISNMTGRVIYRQEFIGDDFVNIDLKSYGVGIYLVNLYDNKHIVTTKILKE
jgi:murein DD-endopeptidase MepM/ murein hydrolase activator NlpD